MTDAVLRLRRGRDRARVHPWVFKGDVADVGPVAPGSVVTVIDAAGRFVGRGLYNPGPALCCRIVTRADEPLDAGLFRRRIVASLARRGDLEPGRAGRLVWSEADLVPGLVVDRYADVLTVQCQTLAMAQRRHLIAAALRSALGDLPVFSADDADAARQEGFVPGRGWLDRPGPDSVIVTEGEVMLRVHFGVGHKTGLYLDQAVNRRLAAELARGGEVLDAFAYTAGFACHALRGGATRAVCIESSPDALAGARDNFALNEVAHRAETRAVNAFDELRRLARSRARFALVIVDPPPFARSRAAVDTAARGYKEINLRALRLLAPGGALLTFSCSYHVSDGLFEDICRDAAADAGVTVHTMAALTQAPDHPVLLTVPESRYLKGRFLRAIGP